MVENHGPHGSPLNPLKRRIWVYGKKRGGDFAAIKCYKLMNFWKSNVINQTPSLLLQGRLVTAKLTTNMKSKYEEAWVIVKYTSATCWLTSQAFEHTLYFLSQRKYSASLFSIYLLKFLFSRESRYATNPGY